MTAGAMDCGSDGVFAPFDPAEEQGGGQPHYPYAGSPGDTRETCRQTCSDDPDCQVFEWEENEQMIGMACSTFSDKKRKQDGGEYTARSDVELVCGTCLASDAIKTSSTEVLP